MFTTSPPDIISLPLEIVMEIFSLSVTAREFYTAYHAHQSTRNRKSLPHERSHAASQVCRRWRAIALSTPHMWTDIPIFRTLNSPWKGRDGWNISVVGELSRYLARSGALPIHIFIDHYDFTGLHPIPDNVLKGILSSFFREAHRWRSAVILIDRTILHRLPIPNLPTLKKLNFIARGLIEDSPSYDYLAPVLNALPSPLDVLVLDGQLQPSYTSGTNVIRPIVETFIGLPPRLEVLEPGASRLKKCILRGIHLCEMGLPPPDKRFQFSALISLELNEVHRFKPCVHFEDGSAFDETTPFNHIDAPNLKELIVKCGRVPHDYVHILTEIRQTAVTSS
ncbi:hypothetical protein CPB83DRAFT_898400 [Crepidotus variabilis]|uniref:F-box domain-containing protein n=1 Tax=Crepidotus variabilis TaxID=179855 RepID=A0A9P6JKC7_9AGAR|nr:hypothetical protein CPB83DRAFT_898400 [Crepidotus variabilis]